MKDSNPIRIGTEYYKFPLPADSVIKRLSQDKFYSKYRDLCFSKTALGKTLIIEKLDENKIKTLPVLLNNIKNSLHSDLFKASFFSHPDFNSLFIKQIIERNPTIEFVILADSELNLPSEIRLLSDDLRDFRNFMCKYAKNSKNLLNLEELNITGYVEWKEILTSTHTQNEIPENVIYPASLFNTWIRNWFWINLPIKSSISIPKQDYNNINFDISCYYGQKIIDEAKCYYDNNMLFNCDFTISNKNMSMYRKQIKKFDKTFDISEEDLFNFNHPTHNTPCGKIPYMSLDGIFMKL